MRPTVTEARQPIPRVGTDFDAETYLDVAAHLVGLPISPSDRPAVVENLRAIAAVAATLMDEPLADDIESAPVFEA